MPLGAFRINTLAKSQATAPIIDYGERNTGFVNLTNLGNVQLSNAQYKFNTGTRGGSILFDGTGDGLNTNQPLLPATDDWTVEAWVYPTTINATDYWFSQYAAGVSGRTTFYYTSTGQVGLFINGGPSFTTSAGAVTANTWTHIAFVRNGSDYRIYINGVDSANATAGGTITQSYNFVVGAQDTAGSNGTIGYMDEIRVSNVARYTTGFTPSTTAFTPDGATLLLLHGDGPYGGTGNFHIVDDIGDLRPLDIHIQANVTQGGTAPSISTAQSKFGGSSFRSYDNEGHVEFTSPAFGSQYTIEFWFRADSVSGTQHLAGIWGGSGNGGFTWMIRLSGSSLQASVWDGSTMILNNVNMGTGVTANTWHHAAITWDGSTYRTFYNGTMGATVSSSNPPNYEKWSTTWIGTAQGTLDNFSGYIDEYRMSDTARYTSSFTPATSAFTNDANTQVLLHFDGTNGATTTTDDVSRTAATTVTTGTYAVSTSSPKYGTGKGATGATASSQLQINMNGSANMDDFFDNTKSITVEFWWQVTSINYSQLPGIISHLSYPTPLGGWWIRTRYDRSVAAQRIPELVYTNGSSYYTAILTGWGVPTVNTWYHVAFENHNGRQNVWVDGTNVLSRATPTNYANNTSYDLVVAETWLGRTGYSTQQESIDELRISQSARYQVDGTSITIPTGAFTNDSTTKCLFHCDGTNGSTTFTDDVS